MYQVTFSDQSMTIINRLDMLEQMELIDQISNLTFSELKHAREPVGRFHRNGKTFYRLKAGEFRCYFEVNGDIIYNHYILTRNSLNDFLIRNKLPVKESQLAEDSNNFWQYLESLNKER